MAPALLSKSEKAKNLAFNEECQQSWMIFIIVKLGGSFIVSAFSLDWL